MLVFGFSKLACGCRASYVHFTGPSPFLFEFDTFGTVERVYNVDSEDLDLNSGSGTWTSYLPSLGLNLLICKRRGLNDI